MDFPQLTISEASGIAMDCAACAKQRAHELEGPTWTELFY